MKIVHEPDLAGLSTLKMGGRAAAAFYPEQKTDLDDLAQSWSRWGDRIMFIGRGSNILFTEDNRDLVLVKWQEAGEPFVLEEDEKKAVIRVDGGCPLPRLIGWCAKAGFSGLEALAGIPGSLGGAVAMNAGSHRVEICRLLAGLEIWSPKNGILTLSEGDFSHGYRRFSPDAGVKEFLILSADIRLFQDSPARVFERTKNFYLQKKKNQPVLAATAGCVFKNPDQGAPAGKLLDLAGYRGRHNGGVCFSEKHANFLVNMSQGTCVQALELIQEAGNKVQRMFGVSLDMEILVV